NRKTCRTRHWLRICSALKHRHPPNGRSRRLSRSIRRAFRTLPSGCAARGMCGDRVIYVQGRSAHGRISREFRQNRPEDVSSASAFAEGTHPDQVSRAVFVTAPDGLRLHIRSYGCSVASALPVVSLLALARPTAVFHALAAALRPTRQAAACSGARLSRPRPIRIRSQPDNYTVPVALADLSAVLIALEIAPAIFLLAMML